MQCRIFSLSMLWICRPVDEEAQCRSPSWVPTYVHWSGMRADREVFVKLSQTVKDIRGTGVAKPLDKALLQTLQNPSVMFHLVPLPSGGAVASAFYGASKDRQDDDNKSNSYGPYQGKGRGKGKSKQQRGGSASAPKGFRNCTGRDAKGRPLCFDWNLGKCNKAPAGASCQKGRQISRTSSTRRTLMRCQPTKLSDYRLHHQLMNQSLIFLQSPEVYRA